MSAVPRAVAVDLTPVLPGGENGGAKVFALELVRRLAAMAPRTRFVLLTQAVSHEELASLDGPNVQREMVVGPATSAQRARLFASAARMLRYAPRPAQRLLARIGYRVNAVMKRGISGGLLRRLGADLLFCPFTAPTYRESGIPTVCTVYDLQYRAYPQFFAVEDAVQRERAFTEACRHATALATISDFSRATAIAECGLEPGKIRTIHLRLPAGREQAHGGDLLGRLGLAQQGYLVYPANFWRHKNHEMLLAAFAMARRDGLPHDMKLVLTGAPGDRQEWIRRSAREMSLAGQVVFPGFVPEDELATLVARSRALVFPSLYEGFGLPVVEAMALGIPVACSNTTALPEVAGDAALLFDPRVPAEVARAIVAIAADEALRQRLAEAGRRRAARFADPQRMADEYWSLFQAAVSASGGSEP